MYYVFHEGKQWVRDDTQRLPTQALGAYLYENGNWLVRVPITEMGFSWKPIEEQSVPSELRLKLLLIRGKSTHVTSV